MINKLMNDYFNINNQIKELESKRDRIKAEIKLFMVNSDSEKYNYNGHLVSYKSQCRKTLDKDKLLNFISEDNLNECYKNSEFKVLKILSKESLDKMKSFIKD